MKQSAPQELGPLVAPGNTSNVYAWGDDAVVKVLSPGIPEDWATREAESTDLVHSRGLPSPEVRDLVEVDGRPGIVLERIDGDSAWDAMVADPTRIPALSSMLAELQAEIHQARGPWPLPTLKERTAENIRHAVGLTSELRARMLDQLSELPDGDTLCHFDVHPNNVMLGTGGAVLIDWFDAAVGDPHADIVRSSLLMRHDAAMTHLQCSDQSLLDRAHDQFVASACSIGEVEPHDVVDWELPLLTSRLAEPMPEGVLSDVLRRLRDLSAGRSSSRLAAS